MTDTTEINKHLYRAPRNTIPSEADKKLLYEHALQTLYGIFEDDDDEIIKMSTICNLLSNLFPYYFWTGFYRVNPNNDAELIVGPYNGTLGCTKISFKKGVCGACASKKEPIIVPNVHAFPGHIACDSKSASEIVVPIFNASQQFMGVFDVDSELPAAFNETDRDGIQKIMIAFFTEQ